MKNRFLSLLCLCAAVVFPERSVLANDPAVTQPRTGTTASPNTGGTVKKMSPRRQQWTRKRLIILQRQRSEMSQPRGTDMIDIVSKAQLYNDPFARVLNTRPALAASV